MEDIELYLSSQEEKYVQSLVDFITMLRYKQISEGTGIEELYKSAAKGVISFILAVSIENCVRYPDTPYKIISK